jgi:peptidyl-prolyl cis-trans isomerase D
MLEVMRKYKRSIVIKSVFVIIVLSFIGTMFLIWGGGEKGFGNSNYAVKIGRTRISFDQFQQTYGRLRNMYQQLSGQPLTPEMEKQLGLKKLALENVVNTALMHNAAKQMGIKVSKDEVIKAIAAIPAFQKNGEFNAEIYQRVLQANRITPKTFEESQQEDLLLKKAREKIMDQVKVTDAEALQAFKKQHDKIDLLFASYNPADVMGEVKLSEADLQTYLQKHQDEFRIPERISISYVLLNPERIASGLSVNNEEMLTYYQKNIDRYQVKGNILPFEEVKDRVRDDALKLKAAKQAYEMAASALNKSMKSADLNEAARLLGLEVEKTPLFTAQQPAPAIVGENELIRQAFALKPGELGGPAETKRGVYLFKINEKRPSEIPPLAQVRARVEKLAANEKAGELAYKKASDALAEMAKGKLPANVQETGAFAYSVSGDIPKIGKSREIMELAFDLSQASPLVKVPVKLGDRWFALKLKNRVETDTGEFQKTKEQIKQNLLPAKREEAVVKWLNGLKKTAKIEVNPQLLAD